MSIESRSRQYGAIAGHWRIRDFLGSGSGGKSAVFRLVHTDSDSVESALKVVNLIEKRGTLDSLTESRKTEYERVKQECKDLAEREVLLMNRLQGRTNIVAYSDHTFVDWTDETGFGCDLLIRMELLKDLRTQIEAERRFGQDEILKIGRDICTALVLCHEKNILHRDIKPENIFYNEDGNYKLGDFGVSRILSAAPMSKASTGVCTPEYAAPEQLSGKYDKRVDIYSLGLVLYELSNGNRLPFAASSYVTETEVQERMLGTPLPAPCNASEPLAAVILKACAYDPEDRYQTAEDFLDALNRLAEVSQNQTVKLFPVDRGTQKAVPVARGNETQYAGSDTGKRKDSGETVYAKPGERKTQDAQPPQESGRRISKGLIAGVVVILALILCFLLREKHEHTWIDATCTSPRTCEECGETEGSALEHQWVDATCDKARACSRCGKTEGTALGHQWIDATCTSPMTCAVCNQVQGSEYGHQWNPADYQSPKTCLVCGETEGRSLGYELGYCSVTSNSNEKNSNSDVALGTWSDKFGQSYASSLRFWVADFGAWSDTEWIEYDVNGQFRQLDITAAAEAGSAAGTYFQIMVYADGKLIYTSEWISYDAPPVQDTIDIQNCSRLRIVCTTDSQAFCYAIVQGTLFN